ncbi:DUF642 domain-containing protein [Chlorobium sp. N1]|uniref:DUF642 domain-containing protein n=1 Tax=Chlorobium sp. N1 TaxID=2491138 RepID=UPI001039EDFC|nr:DUF642 domain-containing protein [Chlorobium sp. N1]TCD47025.1 DUF642 domain-containing protein [Chlorobium sp. N1]
MARTPGIGHTMSPSLLTRALRRIALALLSLPCATDARAEVTNLVVNGSFSLHPYDYSANYYAGSTQLTGWTITTGSVDIIEYGYNGTDALDIDGASPGAISQEIATVIGEEYTFSFAYSDNPWAGNIPSMSATATGDSELSTVTVTGPGAANATDDMRFSVYTTTFVADSELTTLTFTSLSTSGSAGVVLDDIQLYASPVPEPASLVLIGLGGAALVATRKRRLREAA